MTLCIAARAIHALKPVIVMCSDLLIGDEYSTTEKTFKCDPNFALGLSVLFAGTTEDVWDLLRLCKTRLVFRPMGWDEIKEELCLAVKELKDLRPKTGRRGKLDVQLLVCGCVQNSVDILYVDRQGVSQIQDYGAIGIGAHVADAMFRWRMATELMNPFSNLRDLLYFVNEAKRLGGISPYVGKLTSMMIAVPGAAGQLKVMFLPPDNISFLESEFNKYGPQHLPEKRDEFPNFPNVIANSGGHSGSNP